MYGGTNTTGGRAHKHACSTRIEFRKGYFFDDKGNKVSSAAENPVGNIINASLTKSNFCAQDRRVGFYTLCYKTGIDYISDAVDVAIKLGLVNKAGAWFSLVDKETGEIITDENNNTMKFQGKPKVVDYFKENKDKYEILEKNIEELLNE